VKNRRGLEFLGGQVNTDIKNQKIKGNSPGKKTGKKKETGQN